MKWILRVLLLAFVVAGSGCGDCTSILKHGIVLTIIDEGTGSPLEKEATVIATEGSYTETVNSPPGTGTAFLAVGRPGTYRIEVLASGYATWVKPSVRVTRDHCHVKTVELTARLKKAGTG